MEDHSIDAENFSKGAKGKTREGSPDRPSKATNLAVGVEAMKEKAQEDGAPRKES